MINVTIASNSGGSFSGCRYVVAELVLACTLNSAVSILDSRDMVSQPLLLKAKVYLFGYYYDKCLYALN